MSRESALLAALTDAPTSTDDLYDRMGYPMLVRLGMVQYHVFRAELTRLVAAGLAESEPGRGGATLWRLPAPEADAGDDAPDTPTT